MRDLLEGQVSELRRLGPEPAPPLSPPRNVWAAVVAAWVICWRRCKRLAQAGCCWDDKVPLWLPPAAPPPDPSSVAELFQPARKGAAMRCPTSEARDAVPRPAV